METEKMTIERFEELTAEELDELPEEFFRELSGGVLVQEYVNLAPEAVANDRYIMGTYTTSSLGRQIQLFYGSFVRTMGDSGPGIEERYRKRIREVIRHEFRHHLEFLSGIHGSTSLEAEDARNLAEYKRRHGAG